MEYAADDKIERSILHSLLRISAISLALNLSLSGSIANSQDWYECEYSLSKLIRLAKNAEYLAADVQSSESNYEDTRDAYQSCLDYPDIYDYSEDDCYSYKWEYDDALSSYRSSMSELEYALGEFDRTLRNIQYSCNYSFSPNFGQSFYQSLTGRTADTLSDSSLCVSVNTWRAVTSDSVILSLCKKLNLLERCKKCIKTNSSN